MNLHQKAGKHMDMRWPRGYRNSRTTFMLAAAAAASTVVAACSSAPGTGTSASAPANKSGHYHFELITKSNASPYWLAVKAGADAAAKKLGDTVSFEAPASGTDLSTQ